MDDLDLLVELCETVKETSLCGLGQTAPNPVLSTLKYFKTSTSSTLCTSAVRLVSATWKRQPVEVLA
jgi:NADH:ubiquinone oxidoreductase subunit F (NADH-binding)